jgi:hypothetical protein
MPLDPKVREALERRGVEPVRGFLNSTRATYRESEAALPPLSDGTAITRGDMEEWLREKDEQRAKREGSNRRWLIVGAIAAIVGAVAAMAAAEFAYLAIR